MFMHPACVCVCVSRRTSLGNKKSQCVGAHTALAFLVFVENKQICYFLLPTAFFDTRINMVVLYFSQGLESGSIGIVINWPCLVSSSSSQSPASIFRILHCTGYPIIALECSESTTC
jgi:hypothetical protein